ncbi:MAG: hypothetical protein Q9221_003306 [Calogaya cf. arnoldii]
MVTATFSDPDDEDYVYDVDNDKEWYNLWEDLNFTCDPSFIVQSSNFAIDLEDAGEWKQAATIYERLLPAIRTEHGEEDIWCMRFQFGVAKCRKYNEQHEEAEALAQSLLVTRERILGLSHRHTLNVREMLANCYAETGRLDEAEDMLLTVLRLQQQQTEPDHVARCRVVTLLCSVGSKYAKRGALDTAHEKILRYIAQLRTLVDRDNNDLLIVLTYLANACMKLGKDDEAENVLQDILNNRIESCGGWGTDQLETVAAIEQLGDFYDDRNRHREALSLRTSAKVARTQELGPKHQRTIGAHFHLAQTLSEMGDDDEAIKITKLLVEAIGENLQSAGNDNGNDNYPWKAWLLSVQMYLARCYIHSERCSEADRLIHDVLSNLEGVESEMVLGIKSQCHYQLGTIASRENRLEDTRTHRSLALEYHRQLANPEPKATVVYMYGLAFALSELELYDEVEVLVKDTIQQPETIHDVPHKDLADLLLILVFSYIQRDRFADAIPLLEQAIPMREKLR